MNNKFRSLWLVPLLLMLHGSLNVLFGALQLDMIQQGPPAVPTEFDSLHYFATPVPIVLHIVAGILFNLLVPLQFAPVILRRWPVWHRLSGRLLVVSGVLVGATGLWMNQFFPAYGGFLKYSGVMAHSVGIIVSLAVALWAILGRDVATHRAWMMRAVACGLGPATQRLIILPWFLLTGAVNDLLIGIVVWSGLLINVLVVEWILSRERRSRVGTIKQHMREFV